MISRLWHGWTSPDNADAYEKLIRQTIFPGIAGRQIEGFHRIELLRGPLRDEIEFITIMWFNSWEAVREFAGPTGKPPSSPTPPAPCCRGSTRRRSITR